MNIFTGGNTQIRDIKEWSILDLGCGSPESSCADGGAPSDFEAWFPRYCKKLKAKTVIGIDIFPQDPQDQEVYRHIQGDLTRLLTSNNLIQLLPNRTFDLINTCGVLWLSCPSATFYASTRESLSAFFLGMVTDGYLVKTKQMKENLKSQAHGLLNRNGILAIDDDVYINGLDGLISLGSYLEH